MDTGSISETDQSAKEEDIQKNLIKQNEIEAYLNVLQKEKRINIWNIFVIFHFFLYLEHQENKLKQNKENMKVNV